jgi:two-component system, cell cycle sensor histidine kinase and response regulator CckA
MIHHPIKILLIEDNPGDVLLLQETLSEITFVELELVHVDRLKNALKKLSSEDFDVILLDLVLPDSNGLDTFIQIQEQTPATPIVVLTGMTDETLAISAMKAGAQDYLVKGQVSGSDLLLRSMRYAIERKRIEATLQQREQEFRTLAENAPDIIAVSICEFSSWRNCRFSSSRFFGKNIW